MSGIEKLSSKGVLKNIFRTDSDSDSDSDSDIDRDSTNESDEDRDDKSTVKSRVDIPDLVRDPVSVEDCNHVSENIVQYTSPKSSQSIKLHQNAVLGIAYQLWPAANILCDYLDEHGCNILSETLSESVIELGAGIGLCGIFVKKCFPSIKGVLITDLQEALTLIEENIQINNLPSDVLASELCWGRSEDYYKCWDQLGQLLNSTQSEPYDLLHHPPLVIAADCVYWECLFQPFVDTLLYFADMGSTILLSHVKRWKKDNKFFDLCRKKGLIVSIVFEKQDKDLNENTGEERKSIRRIYKIVRGRT